MSDTEPLPDSKRMKSTTSRSANPLLRDPEYTEGAKVKMKVTELTEEGGTRNSRRTFRVAASRPRKGTSSYEYQLCTTLEGPLTGKLYQDLKGHQWFAEIDIKPKN